MILYRTERGAWAGTQADAKALARAEGEEHGISGWEQVDFPTDKPGLLAWLNANVGNTLQGMPADNTPEGIEPDTSDTPEAGEEFFERATLRVPPAPPPLSYTEVSVMTDEVWQALPLGRKLHFAALAVEDARELLKVPA